MDEIQQLYEKHLNTPFPLELRGEEIDGIELVLIDADAAGVISTFLSSHDKLELNLKLLVPTIASELQIVINQLSGSEKAYYENLLKIIYKIQVMNKL